MSQSLKPIAQDQAWAQLTKQAAALPQGLILIGPAGVGKRRAVKALFQYINCQRKGGAEAEASLFGAPAPAAEGLADANLPCGECACCRKIAEGNHADLIEIAPKGDNIAVDDLREMKKTLYFAPMDSKLRFVIIDEAHKLNAASANTLLKTLEEPPAHTRFFLITHERGLLLPTIVSRCQFIHFAPLDRASLELLLERMGLELPKSLLPLCLDLLGGGVSRAGLLADEKTLAFLEQAQASLAAGPRRWEQIVELADGLGSDEWKLELFLDLLVRLSHRNALVSSAKDLGSAYHHADLAMAAAFLRRRLERHANKKLVALAAADLASGGA